MRSSVLGAETIAAVRTSVVESPVDEQAALVAQLRSLLGEVQREERAQGKATHRLGRLGGRLAIASAIGSAAAGLVTALSQTLHGAARMVVIIVAFAGAATSGIAAALRAPERAYGAQGRWLELRSLARRLDFIVSTGLDGRSRDQLKDLIDEVLDRLDQIQGTHDSQGIRMTPSDERSASGPRDVGLRGERTASESIASIESLAPRPSIIDAGMADE